MKNDKVLKYVFVSRMMWTLALIWGIYTETGGWTALGFFLITVQIERSGIAEFVDFLMTYEKEKEAE